MRIASVVSLAVLTVGCIGDGADKGAEEEIGDGKADSFASPSEHGDLGFGAKSAAEFTASARFHSWTFKLSANATVDLATELGAPNLDTVLYLYKQSASGSWGAAIAKNDDANDDNAASALTKKLGKGSREVASSVYEAAAAAIRAAMDAKAEKIRVTVTGSSGVRVRVADNGRTAGRARDLAVPLRLAAASGLAVNITTIKSTIVLISHAVRRTTGR